MPRLVNGERKITKPKPENAGKLLIFCEGHTEYNYLDYFRNYIENNLHAKYSDIVIEAVNTEGNAMHVYDYAENFWERMRMPVSICIMKNIWYLIVMHRKIFKK